MTRDKQPGIREMVSKSGLFWMLFPVFLLVTSVSGWLVMVSMAVDDPGFAVEPDYYKKAAQYDVEMEQRAENSRLGYGVELVSFAPSDASSAALILSVHGAEGKPLNSARVSVDVIPVARAFEAQALTLNSLGAGVFEAKIERPRRGLYEVRVRVEFEGHVFTRVLRPELTAAANPSLSGLERRPPV